MYIGTQNVSFFEIELTNTQNAYKINYGPKYISGKIAQQILKNVRFSQFNRGDLINNDKDKKRIAFSVGY